MTRIVDPRRLTRAVHLDVERLGVGRRYRVSSSHGSRIVDLEAQAGEECTCEDYRFRSSLCKHLLAARLREGDGEVLHGLRELIDDGPKLRPQLKTFIAGLRDRAEAAGWRGDLPAAVVLGTLARELEQLLGEGQGAKTQTGRGPDTVRPGGPGVTGPVPAPRGSSQDAEAG